MLTSVDVTVPTLWRGRSEGVLSAGRCGFAPDYVLVLGSLVVLELKSFGLEELFARVAVVDVLLDSAMRLGMASDSTCETTLAPPGRFTGFAMRANWAAVQR